LLEINIPFPVIFDIYNYYFDSQDSDWQSGEAKFHLLCVIYHLLSMWIQFLLSPRRTIYDIQQFETRRVNNAIDKYISELTTPSQEVQTLKESFKVLARSIFKK